jgi:hypothetical protein
MITLAGDLDIFLAGAAAGIAAIILPDGNPAGARNVFAFISLLSFHFNHLVSISIEDKIRWLKDFQGWALSSRSFKQEPSAPLSLINPRFQQARSCQISRATAQVVDGLHAWNEGFVVFCEFGQHALWRDIVRVIVR